MSAVIRLMRSKKGDSFFIEWSNNLILIDGGLPGTFKEIKNTLSSGKNLVAVFITHVDYDHAGGILRLVKDKSIDISNCDFYVNHPDKISLKEDSLVGFSHGENILNILRARKKEPKQATKGDTIEIQGAKITILTPDIDLRNKLQKNWTSSISPLPPYDSRVSSRSKIVVKRDLEVSITPPSINSDLVNASSISLVFQFEERKFLFLADSHPDLVEESLLEVFDTVTDFDCVKVSHHGSKHNTTSSMLGKIVSDCYIISTNGAGPYYHPHEECLSVILRSCIEKGRKECNFIFNYENVMRSIEFEGFSNSIKIHKSCNRVIEFNES